ncbi:MAG TPA: hypothetical protein VGI07_04265 [Solirubrobacteraceae bacterium]
MRRVLTVVLSVAALLSVTAATATASVLRVGSFHGLRGQYTTIQAAVSAAKPGDWILIAPGDYKTTTIRTPRGAPDFPAGVVITTRNLHIRGMNRTTVIVDGTKPGSARCSRKTSAQNFGLNGGAKAAGPYGGSVKGGKSGANGLLVYKASNVSIENLTACNFLGGSRYAGNQIWWNGGADTGKVEGHGFYGAYLTTTSTYLKNQSKSGEFSAAQYGVFSSNWSGGTWNEIYASNFNDSGFYIGACQQICNQTLNHGWSEYNALGYSGTNSGGRLLVENSQFDNNEDGFSTNTQNADEPAPQNGACPAGVKPPVAGAPSCWVFYRNYVHDNNNPNVPAAGSAAAGPVGTGMSVSGGRNDTIMDNRFANNNAWGMILVPYLDSGKPCFGGTYGGAFGASSCLWDAFGDALLGNTFSHNGSYGHPSNGDFAEVNLQPDPATNCYGGNHDLGGQPVQPATASSMQTVHPTCDGKPQATGSSDPTFLGEVLCDSQTEIVPGTPASCPSGQYPRVTHIVMHPLPKHLKTMPNPCAGVPSNPWCGRSSTKA